MIDIKKYIGKKVYIELESKIDDKDETEDDRVQGGLIYLSLEDIMASANENDEYIEIEISKQYKALNMCMDVVEIKDGKIVPKAK